ncbi:MAG: PLDc N-terminal domain-containing protein, partial [Rikenellaceae bacterium]|nr:PLDc N-terminal domain-containing protein [Rikenellaceae bacterium]
MFLLSTIISLAFSWVWLKPTLTTLYVVFLIIVIGLLIYDRRDPGKSWAWIAAIILIPVIGFILYMIFGRSHRKEKLYSRKEIADLEIQMETLSSRQLYELNNPLLEHRPEIKKYKEIITLLLNNSKALLTARNRVTVLHNGEQTFPAIIEALKKAESFIHIEYYIFKKDRVGREIARIL